MILGDDDIGMWLHIVKYFVRIKNLINFKDYLTNQNSEKNHSAWFISLTFFSKNWLVSEMYSSGATTKENLKLHAR